MQLASCPICNCKAKLYSRPLLTGDGTLYWIECIGSCGLRMVGFSSAEDVAYNWNHRYDRTSGRIVDCTPEFNEIQ